MDTLPLSDHTDSFNSDSNQAARGRKRGISQVMFFSSSQRSSARPAGPRPSSGQSQHTACYCTQRCLLSLQQRSELDHQCSNFSLHQRGQNDDRHCINARKFVQMLNEQLDSDLDHNCTPFGTCESTIDLKLFLYLHGAGDICYMLLMGWAGESIDNVKDKEVLSHEISRSKKKIRMLGVVHKDLWSVNML
ncbi:hypothetical protein AJ78_03129 [Emergomyces pasteurianus Ep9510]|uniref:Protein kinase domain-containing protein n=1 Tax=Emergomyces pasteurianus Ep9510 TaxID=1447872 RepID=A0A1J9PJN7_9EURO|nr:hypothetical protein AJ78_03129 [Emergomyces pasteurianus Ep9510]